MRRLLVLALSFAVACQDEPGGPFGTSRVERKQVHFGSPSAADVLIVVDRSPAMAPFRATLVAQAAQIAAQLETAYMADLHLGVVTSDLGAAGVAVPGCTGDGDGGRLRTDATVAGRFISDVAAADGTRVRNYQGSLADAIGRLLDAGETGCPYSRPLAAARRALDNTVENAGFLRPDAYLAVVVITAQDDCSFADASFLGGSTSTVTARCVQMASSLPAVDDFASYLKGRKADPGKVIIGGVVGPAASSCAAQPGARLHALMQLFPHRHSETSICGGEYAEAFATIQLLFKVTLGIPCWNELLFDADPDAAGLQPVCSASYELADGTGDVLPACGDDDELCWRLVENELACPSPMLSLEIDARGRRYPTGALATIECLLPE